MEALDDREVAKVFFACHELEPQFLYEFQELRCEIYKEQFGRFKDSLKRWDGQGITPADPEAAKAVVLSIMEAAIERLGLRRRVRCKNSPRRSRGTKTRCGGTMRAGKANSSGGIREVVNGWCFGILRPSGGRRRDEERGWGRTRVERARRKEERAVVADEGGRWGEGGESGRELAGVSGGGSGAATEKAGRS